MIDIHIKIHDKGDRTEFSFKSNPSGEVTPMEEMLCGGMLRGHEIIRATMLEAGMDMTIIRRDKKI